MTAAYLRPLLAAAAALGPFAAEGSISSLSQQQAAVDLSASEKYAQSWLEGAMHEFLDIPHDILHELAPAPEVAQAQVGYFLRSMPELAHGSAPVAGLPGWMDGHVIYRSVPSKFPKGMDYHYDGLSSPMRWDFVNGTMKWKQAALNSGLWKSYEHCLYPGAGVLHWGPELCFTNPGVNVLPLGEQLWLTIDNRFWSAVDTETLETPEEEGIIPLVELATTTLNAHPACDYNGNGECLVSYPCANASGPSGMVMTFSTDHLCVGLLRPGHATRKKDMSVLELSRAKLPSSTFLAHSHSPGLTKNFFVVKIDDFIMAKKDSRDAGMLKYMHQDEGSTWLVMDRRTNKSRILTSDFGFVNNHFVNIHEVGDHIVVDTLPGTKNYLENYFRHNLANKTWMSSRWDWIMHEPRRCYVPITGNAVIHCETLLQKSDLVNPIGMDFPSFNPLYKYNPASKWWYITAPKNAQSMWFDTVAKIDGQGRRVVAAFHIPGVYVMEANFIPRPGATEEDDGLLFSVFYNSTADVSFTAFIDPKTMELVATVDMGTVIPYHSHGAMCLPSGKCHSNP